MRRVIIESPYAGDIARNTRYAQRALLDSLRRDQAPFASHLLYTQVLDDTNDEARARGIVAGLAWAEIADCSVFYVDYGMSPGMEAALELARDQKRLVEFRVIGKNPE